MDLSAASHGSSHPPPLGTARYQPLVLVAIAFAAGIAIDRRLAIAYWGWWSVALVTLVVWCSTWRRRQDGLASVILLLAVAATGGAWHHLRWNCFSTHELALCAGETPRPVCLEAIALEAPRRVPAPTFTPLRAFTAGDRSRLVIRPTRLRNGRQWEAATGQAVLTVEGHLLDVRAGDGLIVFGRLSRARRAANPGQFDYALHHRAERRLAQVWTDYPQCVRRASRGNWFFAALLDRVRSACDRLLNAHISQRRAGLAAALLLGLREQLDWERNEQFLETGTVHVLSISGLHVGMLAAGLFGLLRLGWFPRRAALWGVALVTIAYAALTDSGAPVIRAAVLVVATCLALALARPASRWNALAASAIVVLCLNPADLFRAGPQLSFLSVGAIFWAAPRLSQLGEIHDPLQRLIVGSRSWPRRASRALGLAIAKALLLSAAIWLVISPLVLARFHVLAPIALVLNLVLWLPVAGALMFGFALLILGSLAPGLASPLGACLSGSLALLERVVDWGNQFPCGHYWLPGPTDWWLAGFYAGLGLFAVLPPRCRPPRRWLVALLAAWFAVGFYFGSGPQSGAGILRAEVASGKPAFVTDSRAELRCTFLSVGHGLAVVLELPDGQVLLYDAGQLGSPGVAARTVAGYLWSRGHTHVDAIVVSHADLDHFNGIPELCQRISIGGVLVSPMMFEQRRGSLLALDFALREAGIPRMTVSAGDRLKTGQDCRIEVFHPTRQGVLASDNANSVVLAVEYAGRRLLLTGDLESPGLEAVLAEEPYDCDVLLAPHHGSANSNPQGIARWCSPEWVIISGGHDVEGGVIDAYRAAGAESLHTAVVGAITITVTRQAMRVETFR